MSVVWECLFLLCGPKVRKELPALAAQPRAFSRLESLSALLQVFQIFRGRSKARLCLPLCSCHKLAIARTYVKVLVVLSDCLCLWWKDPYLPYQPHPSGSCRALRACPPMHLWPVSAFTVADAKTAVKHHMPTHISPLGTHHKCTLISGIIDIFGW